MRIVALLIGAMLGYFLIYPHKNAPSGFAWLVAMIDGKGKPHFRVSGTVESRMEDLFRRHPQLRPQWRDVPDDENRFLKLREFASNLEMDRWKPSENLRDMLGGNVPWDADAAAAYLLELGEELDALHEIAALPEFSAAGLGYHELAFVEARSYKAMADALAISMRQNLHAGKIEIAHRDFAAIYQMATAMERIEVPSLLAATVGVLSRMSAIGGLRQSLAHLDGEIDWSAWIELMKNDPAPTDRLAHVLRGEACCSLGGMILPIILESRENNRIWNFEAFENAFASHAIATADFIESAQTLTKQDLADLETRWAKEGDGLGKDAREMLGLLFHGVEAWITGYLRSNALENHTLAALQLLEIERAGGPVLAADDPRLAALTPEVFSGLGYTFDPEERRLARDEESMFEGEPDDSRSIQLPAAVDI